jgi:hypothetical protein
MGGTSGDTAPPPPPPPPPNQSFLFSPFFEENFLLFFLFGVPQVHVRGVIFSCFFQIYYFNLIFFSSLFSKLFL